MNSNYDELSWTGKFSFTHTFFENLILKKIGMTTNINATLLHIN